MTAVLAEKACTRCRETKPAGAFHSNPRTRDGLTGWCSRCKAEYDRARYKPAERRPCPHEGCDKLITKGSMCRSHSRAAWNRRNRDRVNGQRRASYAADPSSRRAYNDRYRSAHPEAARQWVRATRARRAEYYRALVAEVRRRRRARLRAALTIPFTIEQLEQRFSMFGHRCWLCGVEATESDHVKPIARGGAHMLANLRPICRSCNARKKDRWPVLTARRVA